MNEVYSPGRRWPKNFSGSIKYFRISLLLRPTQSDSFSLWQGNLAGAARLERLLYFEFTAVRYSINL
jgi:hypothetical protein